MLRRLWFAILRYVRRRLGVTRYFYVSDAGNDANDGLTVMTAKRTIRAAESACGPGDIIMCLPKQEVC